MAQRVRLLVIRYTAGHPRSPMRGGFLEEVWGNPLCFRKEVSPAGGRAGRPAVQSAEGS